MKYKIEHEFPCDKNELIRTMFGKDIISILKPSLTRIIEAELLEFEERNKKIYRKVRYLPVPKIEYVGPKKVEPRWMEWIEHSEVDLDAYTVHYQNIPTTPKVAQLLKNSGKIEFTDIGYKRCKRAVTGELKVDVFLLGMVAERLIYGYAKEIVDEEANAVVQYLKKRNI